MPELPEVETMVRGIRPYVEGRTILKMSRCPCRCRPLSCDPAPATVARRVRGARVDAVRRIAKRVVFDLSTGDHMVIEPRMTGLMVLDDPPDRGHLRFRWQFDGSREFDELYFWDRRGLGTLKLFDAVTFDTRLGPRYLGPDALAMTPKLWRKALSRTSRPIKVALLDQKLVAGIGNLYASEILHRARISPYRSARIVNPAEIARMSRAVRSILETAIRYEGSTLNDGTYRNAVSQNGSYQNEHRVYGRAGQPCPRCHESKIVRIVQAQRSTFYCQLCQVDDATPIG